MVRHSMQFSEYALSTLERKVVKPIRLMRAPSCAVNLYFPLGLSVGRRKVLNCSSEAIKTRWGIGAEPGSNKVESQYGEFVR